MKNILTPEQIGSLYNDGEITLKETEELRELWNNSSEDEKKQAKGKSEKKVIEKSEITDREIQEKILGNLENISSSNLTIKGWLTFFGLLQIISIIGLILYLIVSLN